MNTIYMPPVSGMRQHLPELTDCCRPGGETTHPEHDYPPIGCGDQRHRCKATELLHAGDTVATVVDAPDLPAGTRGKVEVVHHDELDGIDVRLADGQLVNALRVALASTSER